MPEILIDGSVLFSANNGVRLTENARSLSPQKLHAAVTLALAAKRKFTAIRRAEFQANRAEIILAMIESGIPYVCNFDGCGLSRGGSDELTNLQFLCHSHNSSKGDRTVGKEGA